ncbi:hypothetical protein Cgig2_026897 [Carnegiea gigantea]|uniref:Uncharacterized protein n=1 Tax=Carnegiea gigantea TaxID=171969 RepID=A0A9Q1KX14_9CARY|nr:hypothetical protein Cgig2_026897 [Carnegiea gigantea]
MKEIHTAENAPAAPPPLAAITGTVSNGIIKALLTSSVGSAFEAACWSCNAYSKFHSTSPIDGLSTPYSARHFSAASTYFFKDAELIVPWRLGSMIFSNSPFLYDDMAHSARFTCSLGNAGFMAGRAVSTSRRTTPKEYTSDFSENVGGLDISVDDTMGCTCVEVVEPTGCPDAYLEPLLPSQWDLKLGAIEVLSEHPIGHVLIHKAHLGSLITIAHEGHKMTVSELGEQLYLRLELIDSLLRLWITSLYSHLGPIIQFSKINLPKSTNSDHSLLIEVVGGILQLIETKEPSNSFVCGGNNAALARPK